MLALNHIHVCFLVTIVTVIRQNFLVDICVSCPSFRCDVSSGNVDGEISDVTLN